MTPEPVADLAQLKGTNCQFKFIGEGAANIVFEVIVPEGIQDDGDNKLLSILQGHNPSKSPFYHMFKTPNTDIVTGKLLRVPKANTKAFPHPEILQYWESSISPLFDNRKEDLVQQYLVRLDSSIISQLNEVLLEQDSQRRHDFQGTKVAEEAEYGMLVEDMRKSSFCSPFFIFSLSFSLLLTKKKTDRITNRPPPRIQTQMAHPSPHRALNRHALP